MHNYPAGSLADNLTWQALSFMRCEWPFLFSGDNRLRARTFESAISHLARTDGDVLLSYADVVSDQVTVAGQRINVLGLSNVFTFPPYRNEGHASEIVRAAGRQIDASGIDLALLFCEERLQPFYRAHGWLPAPQGGVRSEIPAPGAMVRAVSLRGAGIVGELATAPVVVSAPW